MNITVIFKVLFFISFCFPPLRGCVVIDITTCIADLSFRARPGIQCHFIALRFWMPDQVRHDGQKLDDF